MAAIPAYAASRNAGVDISDGGPCWSTASATGDTFPPSGDNFLFVRSTNSGTVTVSVIGAGGTSGPAGTFLAPYNLGPVVGANTGRRIYGPFPGSVFADVSDGQVHVSYSSSSGVQVAVLNFSAA